ncbi:MAG: OB-fold domain-containing protein [Pseudomonadota bacterium]
MSEETRLTNAAGQSAALEGWYTLDDDRPALIGTRCTRCSTYYFPKMARFCRNPDCGSEEFEEVELSREGTVWSYTDANYQPPEPYVSPTPFEPFAIIGVQLDKEQMIVLGQAARGVTVADLRVGMGVELVLETLFSDDDGDKLVWRWKPAD